MKNIILPNKGKECNVIHNNFHYITSETLKQCFLPKTTNHVDKVICGNGFSTAFLNSKPPAGSINIIIAPNKAVVIDKQQSYNIRKETHSKGLNRQKFFYKESSEKSLKNADVLVFVADSFLMYSKKIHAIKEKINWVLIDEAHSVDIQSDFRKKLIDFTNKTRNIIGSDAALTTVTATPLLYAECNIKIKNDYIKETTIHASNDYDGAVDEIRMLNKLGENILIATNSSNVIYRLRNSENKVSANFNIGRGLMSSLVECCIVEHNDRSNITVISSRGFEGFDIYGKDYNIFYFEDRSNKEETFFISNLYQALNRCRDGYKKINYIRVELSTRRKEPFKNIDKSVNRFLMRSDISVENKQTKKYKDWHPFVIFERLENTPDFTIRRNDVAINLYKEKLLFDNFFNTDVFDTFLKDRNITIKKNFNVQVRLPKKRINENVKVNNLLQNSDLIESLDLFGMDFFLPVNSYDNTDDAYRHVKAYLRRKNYNGRYNTSLQEEKALKLLKCKDEFNVLLKEVVAINKAYHLKKYSLKVAKIRQKDFSKNATLYLIGLIQTFVNEAPSVPKNIVANRDYNLMTKISTDVIMKVGDYFNYEVIEYDIRNCFPRILYALNGLELNNNFYGIDKRYKMKINVFLNDFMMDFKKSTPLKNQKIKAIKKFVELGFDKKVIGFLMDRFFESRYRGDLFNYLSYYESLIIKKLETDILEPNSIPNIRRHDSSLIFIRYDKIGKYDVNGILNAMSEFEIFNQKGWFVECVSGEYIFDNNTTKCEAVF